MTSIIVQTDQAVTFVGAGPVNTELLEIALTFAPFLVAVDGGAEMVRNYGKLPNAVIGDMDSASADALQGIAAQNIHRIADQNTTDFQKALGAVSTPLAVGVGFLGGRADHQMAASNALARHGQPVLLLGDHDAVFRVPEHIALELEPGTRISLFPVAQARVDSRGLRWPIIDAAMSATGLISQSNEARDGRVELWAMGGLLAFLPLHAAGAAITALTRSRQMT